MKNSRQKEIKDMVSKIAALFDPEKIIIFGSEALGNAGQDSDVDLLVVMPLKKSKRQTAIEIGVAVNHIRLSKDIIVTTPEEFAWRKEIPGTIERPAHLEGKVLYARS
jgi:predicted nucleotidyltransferase